MAIFKCKMCGGDLNITADEKIIECEYCGSTQTIPEGNDEKKTNLFNRANRLRIANDFDKAAGIYESIIAEFPDEAESYWGLCLCKFGIEYVDDPKTAKKIPTCHRTSFESIFDDENYKTAVEKADVITRGVYKEEATVIDNLQKDILSIVHKEEPFDVFICYKETDELGQRTQDSVLAQDIYDALTDKGFKVFFSRITLEDKLGKQYEPYIFAALNSAKVMLAIGTKEEYYNAVWVKNEWSRFLALMEKDKEKMLIPCYRDINPYDMPQEFKNLQGQDMSKIGFLQDLVRGITKIVSPINNKSVKADVDAKKTQQDAEKVKTRRNISIMIAIVFCFIIGVTLFTNIKNETNVASPQEEIKVQKDETLSKYVGTWFATTVDEEHNFDMSKYENIEDNYVSIFGVMLEIKESDSGYYAYLSTNLQSDGWITERKFDGDFALPIIENNAGGWTIEYSVEDWRTEDIIGTSELLLTVNPAGDLFIQINGSEQVAKTPLYNINEWQNGQYKYYNQEQSEVRFGNEIDGYNTPIECEIFLRNYFYTKWTAENDLYMPDNIYVVKYISDSYRSTSEDIYFYEEGDMNTLHHASFCDYDITGEMTLDGVVYTNLWQ